MANWKSVSLAVGILVIALVVNAFAQPQPPRGGRSSGTDPRMEQGIDMMFQDMDTNHDGKISKDEWTAAQLKQFNRVDANGDGSISKDEVKADLQKMQDQENQTRRGGGGRPPQ